MNIAHSTFPPNFLVMTLKQSNPTTTKSLKLSKKVKTNVFIFMLHNTIHPSMTSPTRLQECLLPLTKSTHSRSLKRTQPISQATHPIHSPCPLKNNDGWQLQRPHWWQRCSQNQRFHPWIHHSWWSLLFNTTPTPTLHHKGQFEQQSVFRWDLKGRYCAYHGRHRPRQHSPIPYQPSPLYARSECGNKFGEIGEKVAMTEHVQLHNYTNNHPVHANSLSPKECWKALSSLMNIIKNEMAMFAPALAWTAARNDLTWLQKRSWPIPHGCNQQHTDLCYHQCPQRMQCSNYQYPRCIPKCIQQQGNNYAPKRMPDQTDVPGWPLALLQVHHPQQKESASSLLYLYVKLTKAIYGLFKNALLFLPKVCWEPQVLHIPVCYQPIQPLAVSLLLNLEAAQWGRRVLFSDEQRLLFEGRKKGFA